MEGALRRAEVLVPVLTPEYFRRAWYLAELFMMYRRFERTGARCILPLRLFAGDFFAPEVSRWPGGTWILESTTCAEGTAGSSSPQRSARRSRCAPRWMRLVGMSPPSFAALSTTLTGVSFRWRAREASSFRSPRTASAAGGIVSKTRAGYVVTFYSFKGGVGRTQALVDVGGLSAEAHAARQVRAAGETGDARLACAAHVVVARSVRPSTRLRAAARVPCLVRHRRHLR